ncbi:ABC transporter substrate-binding protein [Butyrivibrio sp. AE3006]|uniref:ABC transporter substrate-binding protein n=1 Tax=Butyrivibrio sp. AE3006 TaxID=1280673 RepID=UPI0004106238|nr:MqnA/MqnD/SBP family protein [Butyrivibrio sp. AE3006]
MKKRILSMLCVTALTVATLAGCGSAGDTASEPDATEQVAEVEATDEPAQEAEESEASDAATEVSEEEVAEATEEASEEEATEVAEEEIADDGRSFELLRIGSLKGPTTMGIVNMMKDSEEGKTAGNYEFEMATQPDELASKLVAGDLDIALIPANLASVLYNKTEGGISFVDINTLGVLYCVTGDESVKTVADLAGKTVITTGQGATPEYSIRYLLDKNEVTDCTLDFKSEATEVAAVLENDPTSIAVLPQPFVTSLLIKNENVKIAFSLADEWENLSERSQLITGVTVVRNEYLDEHVDEVENFIDEHVASVVAATSDEERTAELIAEYGIIEKKEIAKAALPNCNIVCITGEAAGEILSGYLETLFAQDPKSVGGQLPDNDFYKLR